MFSKRQRHVRVPEDLPRRLAVRHAEAYSQGLARCAMLPRATRVEVVDARLGVLPAGDAAADQGAEDASADFNAHSAPENT